MQYFAVAALLAATVLAFPEARPESGPKVGNTAQELYGKCSNGKRSCCNSNPSTASLSSEQHSSLLGLLDGGSIIPDLNTGHYSGCSDLANLIPGECQGSIACCDNNSVNNGVNVVIPCVGIPVGL